MKCYITRFKTLFSFSFLYVVNGVNMIRKKNLNTKEERLFLAAKAIKESIIRNLPIEDGGYNCPI